jgi:hypothetical protein
MKRAFEPRYLRLCPACREETLPALHAQAIRCHVKPNCFGADSIAPVIP